MAVLVAQLQQLQIFPNPAVSSEHKDAGMAAEGAAADLGSFGSLICLKLVHELLNRKKRFCCYRANKRTVLVFMRSVLGSRTLRRRD